MWKWPSINPPAQPEIDAINEMEAYLSGVLSIPQLLQALNEAVNNSIAESRRYGKYPNCSTIGVFLLTHLSSTTLNMNEVCLLFVSNNAQSQSYS